MTMSEKQIQTVKDAIKKHGENKLKDNELIKIMQNNEFIASVNQTGKTGKTLYQEMIEYAAEVNNKALLKILDTKFGPSASNTSVNSVVNTTINRGQAEVIFDKKRDEMKSKPSEKENKPEQKVQRTQATTPQLHGTDKANTDKANKEKIIERLKKGGAELATKDPKSQVKPKKQ